MTVLGVGQGADEALAVNNWATLGERPVTVPATIEGKLGPESPVLLEMLDSLRRWG